MSSRVSDAYTGRKDGRSSLLVRFRFSPSSNLGEDTTQGSIRTRGSKLQRGGSWLRPWVYRGAASKLAERRRSDPVEVTRSPVARRLLFSEQAVKKLAPVSFFRNYPATRTFRRARSTSRESSRLFPRIPWERQAVQSSRGRPRVLASGGHARRRYNAQEVFYTAPLYKDVRSRRPGTHQVLGRGRRWEC